MLKGGLNQVIFLFLILFFSLLLFVHVLSNCRFVLHLFFWGASVYAGHASLDIWPFLELVDRRLLMIFGGFLINEGG